MQERIFISYRRGDTAWAAGRIHDRLALEIGRDRLFMDIHDIPPGANFKKVVREEVAKCSHLLAVIGKHWYQMRPVAGG